MERPCGMVSRPFLSVCEALAIDLLIPLNPRAASQMRRPARFSAENIRLGPSRTVTLFTGADR
jgi:hypothetical protein